MCGSNSRLVHFETATTKPRQAEIIWFGSKANLDKLKADELCLHFGSVDIRPSTVVRDLVVWLDSELTMRDHISRTASSYFFNLRRLRQLRGVVCCSTMQRLVSSLVLSRLDIAMRCCLDFHLRHLILAASSQCCNPSRRWSWSSRPLTDQMKKLHCILVANQIPYQFQVMSDDSRRCDWSMPAIHS